MVHIFSLHLAVRYSFWISQAKRYNPFNEAIVNAILIESRDTTEEYVIEDGASVIWPPPTSHAFCLKFFPILTSNIMWHLICWYPIDRSALVPLWTWKAGLTLPISWKIASHHLVFPFSLSSCNASFTDLGILTLYLCVFCQYLFAVFDTMWSLFFRTYLIHHSEAGCSYTLFFTAYSTRCTGYASFTSLNWFHMDLPSFHWIHTSQPLVVSRILLFPLEMWMNASYDLICDPSVRQSIISSKSKNLCPSWSTCANRLLAMALTDMATLWPSSYSTLYIQESSMGFLDAVPIGRPSFSFSRLAALANLGPSPCLSRSSSMFK